MDAQRTSKGNINPLLIVTIVLGVLVIGLGIFGFITFANYSDQKNNVDQKVDQAVAVAKLKQSEEDELKFADREKQPKAILYSNYIIYKTPYYKQGVELYCT